MAIFNDFREGTRLFDNLLEAINAETTKEVLYSVFGLRIRRGLTTVGVIRTVLSTGLWLRNRRWLPTRRANDEELPTRRKPILIVVPRYLAPRLVGC